MNAPKEFCTVEDIARVCHEANRAYCESLGDSSQVPWYSALGWQKTSAINGVTFHLNNPGSSPEDSHSEWLKEKEANGWKYGPVKDSEKKEHPCFLPYAELSPIQQNKDRIFIAIVNALRGSVRYDDASVSN